MNTFNSKIDIFLFSRIWNPTAVHIRFLPCRGTTRQEWHFWLCQKFLQFPLRCCAVLGLLPYPIFRLSILWFYLPFLILSSYPAVAEMPSYFYSAYPSSELDKQHSGCTLSYIVEIK